MRSWSAERRSSSSRPICAWALTRTQTRPAVDHARARAPPEAGRQRPAVRLPGLSPRLARSDADRHHRARPEGSSPPAPSRSRRSRAPCEAGTRTSAGPLPPWPAVARPRDRRSTGRSPRARSHAAAGSRGVRASCALRARSSRPSADASSGPSMRKSIEGSSPSLTAIPALYHHWTGRADRFLGMKRRSLRASYLLVGAIVVAAPAWLVTRASSRIATDFEFTRSIAEEYVVPGRRLPGSDRGRRSGGRPGQGHPGAPGGGAVAIAGFGVAPGETLRVRVGGWGGCG